MKTGEITQLKLFIHSRKGRFRVVYSDFGHLGGNARASLPLCTLPHFNTCELQRFTSWVALCSWVSLPAVGWFCSTRTLFNKHICLHNITTPSKFFNRGSSKTEKFLLNSIYLGLLRNKFIKD